MGMFVSGEIIVTASGIIDPKDLVPELDAITILPKMSYGVRQRVIGAATKVTMGRGGNRAQRRAQRRTQQQAETEVDVGAYQIALLVQNIIRWQGPSFANVACTPANIEMLNPDEPLVKRVLEEIGERNGTDVDEEDGDDPNVIEGETTSRALTKTTSPR